MTAYRKWGHTVRFENGTTVRVEEAGEAFESPEGEFVARPFRSAAAKLPPLKAAAMPPHSEAERVVIVNGVAMHEYGDVTWTERVERVHVAVARAPFRMLLDELPDDALLETFARIGGRRETPPRLLLAPRVTAAVLPTLRIELAQRAGETPDGYGRPVLSCPVEGEPPNWWRPSYRVRPRRAWFNLMALPFGRLEENAPRAVALLDGGDVLCVDGAEVFASALKISRVLAVGGAERWYPYGAGAWGADMLLESGSR
jgi:hypothetical protein